MAAVARAAVAGFEAFPGEALGDGSDPDAAGRFLVIYQSSAVACAQNREFNMPGHMIAAIAVSCMASPPTRLEESGSP